MMDIFLYVPGALQLVTVLLVVLILAFRARGFKPKQIPLSLIGVSSLYFILALVDFSPYLALTYALIAGVGFLTLRKGKPWQILSLPMALAIYVLCLNQMTFVELPFVVDTTVSIGERGKKESGNPEELLVEFRFGENGDHVQAVYSDELATSLSGKTSSQLTLGVSYHWGRLAATNIEMVDGKPFKSAGGYAGCSVCKTPYPKYYFGLKSF